METIDAALLSEPAPRGARVIALELLARLSSERDRLSAPNDDEALHDFRVALRRLRSWLRALRGPLKGSRSGGARRRLRRLAKASNAGRDAEVLLEWLRASRPQVPAQNRSVVRWLVERFERQQREAESSLDELIRRNFARAHDQLSARLEQYRLTVHVHGGVQEAALATVLASLIREHAGQLRERLGQVQTSDDDAEAHRARIAGKHLRYLLEPLAALLTGGDTIVERLKGLQDSLGDMHDAHIWLLMLSDMASVVAMEEGRRVARSLSARRRYRRAATRERYPSLSGFTDLARLAQARAETAYQQFSTEWDKRGSRRFFKDLEAACVQLEAQGRANVEIERKFLLTALPPSMPEAVTSRIEQGYLPGTNLVERLRAERPAGNGDGKGREGPVQFFRTVKSGRGIVRTEIEEETTPGMFDTLWPLTEGRRLWKLRHRVSDNGLTWEVDEFPELGLVLAELELPSAETVVRIPEWLAPYVAREVTGEREYLNVNLAR